MENLLSITVFLPLVAAAILALFLRGEDEAAQRNAKWLALIATSATFLVSLAILIQFDPADPGFQFVEESEWLLGMTYKVGVDGMSVLFVMLTTFIMPLVIAAAGFVLGRTRGPDVDPLNTAVVYVLAPALVFHSLATTELAGSTVLKLAVGVVAFVVVLSLLAEAVGRALGIPEPVLGAFVLVAAYPNSGNFGIPLSAFAFGDVGRATAVLFLAVQAVLVYTHGVYVAARSGEAGRLAGVRKVFELPLVYAVVAAIAMRFLGLVPPAGSTAMETLRLVGDASIPVMLLVLGIQLAGTDLRGSLGRVGAATALKLVVAPAVALGVALALGIGNVGAARVFVLEAGTPAAITPLILVIEFGEDGDAAADFVSATVLVSTLASVVTLTALVALLRSGVLV